MRLGIIGDDFMHPDNFIAALRSAGVHDRLRIDSMTVGWPLEVASTKKDPFLPVAEFVGRPEDYFDFIADKEILVVHTAPLTADSMIRAPRLKLIGVARGGPVNVETTAAAERGIKVVNTPGRNASAVADFTIVSIMAGLRHLLEAHRSVADGSFSRRFYHRDFVGREISEVTVGGVGYGAIGRRVVKLLSALGAEVLVYDPYASLDEADVAAGVQLAAFDDLIARSDVVTLHPRVTPETSGMISREVIARMKPQAYVVNTTRGEIMDYDALYDALASGHLSGAALDTFPTEPPAPDMPLLQLPNVILSPHIAGASARSIQLAAEILTNEIVHFLDGQPQSQPT